MGLRYVADLTEAQVAEVMGVARGTVASTLSDARRRLATKLAEFTIEPSSDSEAVL
jgi:RNA polymerase sigma-70 factor (ECF subfamily)